MFWLNVHDIETESPFTEEIRMAIMPDRLKLPDSKYDGTGDPADHLENYRSWMELNSATNAFKCRAFVITLTGVARRWFRTLRPGTISSFRQLSKSFISQFAVHKIHRKPARHLYTITQRENETTESYLTRFVKEEMNVQDRSDAAASGALMAGLRNSTVLKYLVSVGKPDTVSYPELITETRRHIDAEKASNLDASKLSQDILLGGGKRKMDSQVERLIQMGQLREYVRGANQQPRQPAQPVARPQPQDNHDLEVRTIMGGPATGETNRARKNYARQSRTDPFPHQVNLTGHKEKIPRLSYDPIIFTKSEARGLWHPHTDAIVVTLRIAGRKVFRILVDNGTSSLSGFTGDSISSEGILNLPVELGSSPCQHIQAVDFVLVDCPSPYNAIIGRPTLNKIRAVTSTYHLLVKFPTVGGIGILRGDQTESREIYEAANRSVQVQGIKSSAKSRDETPTTNIPNENGSVNNSETTKAADIHGVNAIHLRDGVHCINSIMIGTIEVKIDEVKKFDELDPREPVAEQHGEPVEELTEVLLFDDEPEKTCKIGSALTGQFKEDLIIFLREHRDVFAWSHEDMPGIDPSVIVHRLNIDPNFKPVKQKR
ncbi:hypothetical protein UlMin_018044 [Ulmus minor]